MTTYRHSSFLALFAIHKADIKCLTESYIGFIPNESKVFTLDYSDSFQILYAPSTAGKGEMKERICNQLATVCAFLGEYPTIRCQQ